VGRPSSAPLLCLWPQPWQSSGLQCSCHIDPSYKMTYFGVYIIIVPRFLEPLQNTSDSSLVGMDGGGNIFVTHPLLVPLDNMGNFHCGCINCGVNENV